MEDSPLIDAHHHFWELGRFNTTWLEDPKLAAIHRTFLPDDLVPHLRACGVRATVFVQTQHNLEEARWVMEMAQTRPWLVGVVGWIDLSAGAACETTVLELKQSPLFVGVRHIVHDELDDDWIVREEVIEGLKVLEKYDVPFDLLFYPRHLKHVGELVRRLPHLRMVIDHVAKPSIRSGQWADWRADLKQAASFPTVFCKLSGMVTEAAWDSWKPSDLKRYADTAFEAFGPSRIMFGSDWPVCELAGSYERVVDAAAQLTQGFSESERKSVFESSAIHFYRLDASSLPAEAS